MANHVSSAAAAKSESTGKPVVARNLVFPHHFWVLGGADGGLSAKPGKERSAANMPAGQCQVVYFTTELYLPGGKDDEMFEASPVYEAMTMVDLQTRQLAANFYAGQDLDRVYQKHNNLKVNLDTIQGAKNPHLVPKVKVETGMQMLHTLQDTKKQQLFLAAFFREVALGVRTLRAREPDAGEWTAADLAPVRRTRLRCISDLQHK